MKLRLFNILSAFSLVLCISVAGIWVYAAATGSIIWRQKGSATASGREFVFSRSGFAFLTRNVDDLTWSQYPIPWSGWVVLARSDWVVLRYAHSRLPTDGTRPTTDSHAIYVPYWPVLLSVAILRRALCGVHGSGRADGMMSGVKRMIPSTTMSDTSPTKPKTLEYRPQWTSSFPAPQADSLSSPTSPKSAQNFRRT